MNYYQSAEDNYQAAILLIKEKVIKRLHALGIAELKSITVLNELDGDYINLVCRLPNGETGKILNDDKKYFAAQVEQIDSDRCYGVAADEHQIAVYQYGCNGADAELVLWAII